ncbi:Synaptotagmin-7 [Hordeum vulgare]|nr:Synaptotagmin-7 [Hordeum vulgare]
MGRSKSNLEESEVADLLAMKGEFLQHREETTDLRGEVDDLRSINLKQDTMVSVLDGVPPSVRSCRPWQMFSNPFDPRKP